MNIKRLSLTCELLEGGRDVKISVTSHNPGVPGDARPLGSFAVDLAGWLTFRTFVQLTVPAGMVSYTGDSVVDAAAVREGVARG